MNAYIIYGSDKNAEGGFGCEAKLIYARTSEEAILLGKGYTLEEFSKLVDLKIMIITTPPTEPKVIELCDFYE